MTNLHIDSNRLQLQFKMNKTDNTLLKHLNIAEHSLPCNQIVNWKVCLNKLNE